MALSNHFVNRSEALDWWDEIDENEKAEIEESLEQADRGEVIAHKEVMTKYQKWLS